MTPVKVIHLKKNQRGTGNTAGKHRTIQHIGRIGQHCSNSYTHTYTHTHVRARTHTDTHKHTHLRMLTRACTHTHHTVRAHTKAHTHIHTHTHTRGGELRTQKLKVQFVENTELEGSPFKAWVGQYIAIHATLTARDFFLANFYPFGPFTCIFFQNLSQFFPVLAAARTGSCVGPQNEIGHPAGFGFPC